MTQRKPFFPSSQGEPACRSKINESFGRAKEICMSKYMLSSAFKNKVLFQHDGLMFESLRLHPLKRTVSDLGSAIYSKMIRRYQCFLMPFWRYHSQIIHGPHFERGLI